MRDKIVADGLLGAQVRVGCVPNRVDMERAQPAGQVRRRSDLGRAGVNRRCDAHMDSSAAASVTPTPMTAPWPPIRCVILSISQLVADPNGAHNFSRCA